MSNDFRSYCEREGITSYTPQHNSKAEKRNRTLVNMAKCMLKGRNMPKLFWEEAVSTTTYILNRSPTKLQ